MDLLSLVEVFLIVNHAHLKLSLYILGVYGRSFESFVLGIQASPQSKIEV